MHWAMIARDEGGRGLVAKNTPPGQFGGVAGQRLGLGGVATMTKRVTCSNFKWRRLFGDPEQARKTSEGQQIGCCQ